MNDAIYYVVYIPRIEIILESFHGVHKYTMLYSVHDINNCTHEDAMGVFQLTFYVTKLNRIGNMKLLFAWKPSDWDEDSRHTYGRCSDNRKKSKSFLRFFFE